MLNLKTADRLKLESHSPNPLKQSAAALGGGATSLEADHHLRGAAPSLPPDLPGDAAPDGEEGGGEADEDAEERLRQRMLEDEQENTDVGEQDVREDGDDEAERDHFPPRMGMHDEEDQDIREEFDDNDDPERDMDEDAVAERMRKRDLIARGLDEDDAEAQVRGRAGAGREGARARGREGAGVRRVGVCGCVGVPVCWWTLNKWAERGVTHQCATGFEGAGALGTKDGGRGRRLGDGIQ